MKSFALWPIFLFGFLGVIVPVMILSALILKVGQFLTTAGELFFEVAEDAGYEWKLMARPGMWSKADNAFREAQVLRRDYEERHPEYAEKPRRATK